MNFKESILSEYPDIFEGLTEHQIHKIINTAASHWLDGFEPTRETLQDAANIIKGTMTAQDIVDIVKNEYNYNES